ncbi:MinD/ParA family ATP-binding protein [Nocardiopsis coralliicola]
MPEPEMLPPLAEAPDDGAIDDAEPQTVRLAPRRGPAGAGPSAPEPAAQEPPEPAPLPEADEAGESTVRLNPGGAGAPAAGSAAPAGPALPGADGADPGDETVRLGPGPAPAGAAPGGTDEFEGTVPVRPGGRTTAGRGAAPPPAQQAPAPQRGPGAPEQAGGHAPPSGGAPAEHQWGQLTGGHQSLLHSAPPAPVRPQPQPQPQPQGQGQQPPQGHPAAPQPAPPQPDPQAAAWGPPAQTGQQPPAAPYSAGPAQQQPAPPQHPSQPNAGFAPPQGQQGQQGPPPYGAPAQPGAPYGAPPYGQPQQYGPAGYGPQPYEQPPIQAGPEELDTSALVRGGGKKSKPRGGWRKAVHAASLGLVSPGESAADKRRNELVGRARTHVAGGHHRVAVLSLKGGVGKTTTTVALGSMLASLRGDRVLAVDANPDRGTLSDKVRLETAATIRDLLNEQHAITRYADIRGFTSQAASRLEILASDRDPAVSEAFSESDYREVTRLLEHYYSICLTDCGTGLLHSAMRGVLGLADQVVLVSSPSVDGARSASATLDWLEAHEYGYLVRGAVVVLSMVRSSGKSSVDLDRLEQHFAGRCRAVVRVPWDPHLEEGAEVDLERLATSTRDAYLRLSATVGEAFAWPR